MTHYKKYIVALLMFVSSVGIGFTQTPPPVTLPPEKSQSEKLPSENIKSETPPSASQAQTPYLTPEEKRDLRKNLVVKEMNADAKGKHQWLDHLTVWDENGFKIEEIEYAVYGQRERVTFEYNDSGQCIRENVYDDKNKLYRIRKYEYLPNGRKKTQYNYLPDGKLYSTKIYEYSYK